MQTRAPQDWWQESIEKLSPWVWLMQNVISLWYITEGRKLPEARKRVPAFWPLGHAMLARRYASRASQGDPGTQN